VLRRLLFGVCLVAGTPTLALANGRPPQILNLHIRPGTPSDVLAPATFGPLFTTDGGETWEWMCESAVGYGGTYDPDYAVTATGAVFATTFDGLKVKRPGSCVWELSPFGETFAANVAAASDGTVYVAISTPGNPAAVPPLPADYKFYRSTNDGTSFDAGVVVTPEGEEWWQSLEAAPSDPDTIYLTGYRFQGAGMPNLLLMFRSTNGGQTWTPLPVTAFTTTERTDLEVVAIHPTDPDRVLLKVTNWSDVIGDDFWLTTNGGQSWTNVLRLNNYGFGVFRANGDAVIATPGSGIHRSTDGGMTFSAVPEPTDGFPDVYCLREVQGVLWACTQNYAQAPYDAAVMTTTDFTTWTHVMKFMADVTKMDCPDGTIQEDCCNRPSPACPLMNAPSWCLLAMQIGVSDPDCVSDMTPDAGPPPPPGPDGCCGAAGHPAGTALLVGLVGFGLIRRRRRR
jgi:uncharacterized protein (TIGR03382 family)